MTSIVPNTEDFSSAVAHILNKAIQECGGGGGASISAVKIETPSSISSTSLRSWLFKNLESDSGHVGLKNAIIKMGGVSVKEDLSHAYRNYFQARWFPLTVCIIALLFFVVGLIFCCALSSKFRGFCRGIFCCQRSSRDDDTTTNSLINIRASDDVNNARGLRSMHSQEQSQTKRRRNHPRVIYLTLTILSCLCMCLILGLGIEAFLKLTDTQQVISCNMWLELSGYFEGATDLKSDKVATLEQSSMSLNINDGMTGDELVSRISTDWPGVLELDDRLVTLRQRVNSTDEASLYQLFSDSRNTLKEEVDVYVNLVNTDLEEVNDYIESYDAALATMKTELRSIATFGDWNAGYSFIFSLKKVYKAKQKVFEDEITNAVAQGWSILDSLLEKYTGASAELMAKANAVLDSGQNDLHQINAAIQAMANVWDGMSTKMKMIVILLIVLSSVTGVCALIASILSIHLIYRRTKRLSEREKLDLSADEAKHKTCWIWTAVFCGIAISLSCLIIAITFPLSSIGSDACQTIDQDLMTDGQWDLLGQKILYPNGDLNNDDRLLDLRPVLDTCIKRGANGAIGKTLGLDSQLAELSNDLDNAFDDIRDTRVRLLHKNARNYRVHVIGFLMRELLRGFSHEAHFKSDSFFSHDTIPVFNELQEINFENHTSPTEGRRVLLSPVPYWPSAVNSITGHGIESTLGSIVDAYITLNDISDQAFKANSTSPPMPRFCGALAKKRKLACSYYNTPTTTTTTTSTTPPTEDPRPIIDLSDPNSTKDDAVSGWLTRIETDVPTYGLYKNSMKSRVRHLIGAMIYVERAANLDAELLGLTSAHGSLQTPVCLDAETNTTEVACTFDDARQYHQKELDKVWEKLSVDYDNVIRRYDAYVDELIIPKSQSMMDDANNIIFESNCQFQGTQLDNGVYAPLCWTFLPIMTELSLLSFFTLALMLIILLCLRFIRPGSKRLSSSGDDQEHSTISLNDIRSHSVAGGASKEFVKINPNLLLEVPPQNAGQHSISSASYRTYRDSVYQYGSDTRAPIFSPIRVRHYN